MIDNCTKDANVSIYANEHYYFIQTLSRYNLLVRDYRVPTFFLSKDIEASELGKTVKLALSKSQVIELDTNENVFSRDGILSAYNQWINEGKELCGFKTKKMFLKNMVLCQLTQENNSFEIRPTSHDKLETWSGGDFIKKDYIVLIDTVSDLELGESIKEVISRCKNKIK